MFLGTGSTKAGYTARVGFNRGLLLSSPLWHDTGSNCKITWREDMTIIEPFEGLESLTWVTNMGVSRGKTMYRKRARQLTSEEKMLLLGLDNMSGGPNNERRLTWLTTNCYSGQDPQSRGERTKWVLIEVRCFRPHYGMTQAVSARSRGVRTGKIKLSEPVNTNRAI